MGLVGFRYIQASDPGAVGAGYQWLDTDNGSLYERNTSNTAWVSVGNVDNANWGLLPLTGGTMTGAINGVTGWAPLDSPDFTTSAKLDGVNLATSNDISTMQSTILALIDSKVASAVASASAGITVRNKIAVGTGNINHGATIPLPTYSDGSTALLSEVVGVMVGLGNITYTTGSEATNWQSQWYVNPTTLVVDAKQTVTAGGGGGIVSTTGQAQYVIICMKAT